MIDPLYILSGLAVGVLVGLTGVGGGSLMTPLLVLLFGIHPATAVGTDLLYAACTKSAGVLVHAQRKTVDWSIVWRLAAGSLPGTALTLFLLNRAPIEAAVVSRTITPLLAVMLLISAIIMLFQQPLLRRLGTGTASLSPRQVTVRTIAAGLVLGVLVSLTSVGAGALGAPVLSLLYPRLTPVRIVGSDIAHAVPLTFLAGLGYLYLGAINWVLLGSLLTGSIPGIIIGSLLASYIPGRLLRIVLAMTMVLAGVKLLT